MNRLTAHLNSGIHGIQHKLLKPFIKDKNLGFAIKSALPKISNKKNNKVQSKVLNFYPKDTINPYTAVSAKGPWLVTSNGAILYDVGGYGMLGFGHSPNWALDVLAKPHVMANIMTPNEIQYKFTNLLQNKIGMNRDDGCPYSKFAFLNSGSESMELALRIADIKRDFDDNKKPHLIVLNKCFHGRTGSASRISDSSKPNYLKYLQSFPKNNPVKTVEVNNVNEFKSVYNKINQKHKVNAVIMEPVMGEGNPGVILSQEFYNMVRSLTQQNGSDLIIDSIQAGIRGTGYLSVCDYDHLKKEDGPDMEVFSKAIASGQFPLSVLAMKKNIASRYVTGLYGNTMTGNPKALEIGYETLKRLDDNLINNIQQKGYAFKFMLEEIREMYPEICTHVSGSGLLLALHIKDEYPVDKGFGLEYICRSNGLNVIHGGKNALRFTPHFLINDNEIQLVKEILEISLKQLVDKPIYS